jgi:glycosyltransferase involved in cell wall biosynthesis
MINLSVIAPYFEETSICSVVKELVDYLDSFESINNFEILLFNDGSSTEFNLLVDEKLKNIDFRVNIIKSEKNVGPGVGYVKLIEYVKYEYTLLTDADGQFLISSLNNEVLESISIHDAVLFYRERKIDSNFSKLGARISNFISNRIYGSCLKDFSCAFKIIKSDQLRKMKFSAKYMNYSIDHTGQVLINNISYKEHICLTNKNVLKRRSFKSEISRAYKRFLFLFYVSVKSYLVKKNVIIND